MSVSLLVCLSVRSHIYITSSLFNVLAALAVHLLSLSLVHLGYLILVTNNCKIVFGRQFVQVAQLSQRDRTTHELLRFAKLRSEFFEPPFGA